MTLVDDDLPDGWITTTMGEVADVVGGGTPKTTIAGNFDDVEGHPWLTPADLTGHREKTIAHGRRFLTDQGLTTSAAKYMPAGTILFSSRAPIGYVAIAANPVTTNQGFRSFVPSGRLDSSYAYHYLRSIKDLAEQMASGTTFNELSGSKAKTLPIPLPPVDEQRRIAAWLDEIDVRRSSIADRLAAARAIVDRLRTAVLAAACAGRLTVGWRDADADAGGEDAINTLDGAIDLLLPGLPASYNVSTVGAVSERIDYGTSKKADTEGDVPVLRMGNVQDGRIDTNDLKYLPLDGEVERLLLDDGDLLFNRTNSPDLVGKTAVFHGYEPATFASYLIRVRFRNELIEPDFVGMWLNSAWGRAWARHVKTDGVSQSNINAKKLAAMPLPVPPIDEQREIVRRATAALVTADRVTAEIRAADVALAGAIRGVLAKAFGGQMPGA